MRPVLFVWRDRSVRSFPTLVTVGLTIGLILETVQARADGLSPLRVWVATVALLMPAFIGARLFYVFAHWDVYQHTPARMWQRSDNGSAMYGGLLAALPICVVMVHVVGLALGVFLDLWLYTILTALIFGRLGCFLSGCCAGKPTLGPLGIVLPNSLGTCTRRYPTQLLEAAFCTLLLLMVVLTHRSLTSPGALFLVTTAAYALGRFGLDFLREEHHGRRGRAGLMVAQRTSAAVLVMAVLAWVVCAA